ncbi:MAG: sulfite exporter TauE/SafE family protein [Armatimonadetes bacterium]|nr:sulfite exporter TauE/SafE family protein [Armatimonadota bacterium]
MVWQAIGFGLVTGLVMSGHCVGMCGMFVAAYAARRTSGGWVDHALFNLGRLATFTTLGTIGGALGGVLNSVGQLAGWLRPASLVAGVLMALFALGMLGVIPGVRLPLEPKIAGSSWFRKRMGQVLVSDAPWRPLAIGLLVGFLPCGALHMMVVAAAGYGSAALGGAVLAAYAVGTTPALFAFGLIARALSLAARRRLVQVGAVLVLLMAVEALVRSFTGHSLVGSFLWELMGRLHD